MNDKVSIIIPTYNRGKLIKKSIMSCLNQTYTNIEVIIVDDGSTDNTGTIVKSIKDTRIKYIKLSKNKGACYARNIGIKKSTGKYITFNDSDDLFLPQKIELQLSNLLKNNSDFDFCKVHLYDKYSDYTIPTNKQLVRIKKHKYVEELLYGNYISNQAFLIKRKILIKNLYDENLPRLQDYDLVLRIIPTVTVSFTNEELVNLYRQKDSISTSNERWLNAICILTSKKYKLTNEQKLILNTRLIEDYVIDFTNKYDSLANDNKYLKKELLDKETQLINLNRQYNLVVNSRTWKLRNRFIKIFKR